MSKLSEKNLHAYQNTAVDHILENPFCGLFLDMGLGKTVSTLTAIKKLMYEDLDIETVLVIAPKRVAESVWTKEIENWSHLTTLKTSRVIGTAKQRERALAAPSDIYLIGRDNVTWLCGLYGGSMLPFDMLVIDESSSFKNPKSLRFKALRSTQPSFSRVVLLTGTPAPNGLIDLWSQIFLLDRGERLGRFITRYREEYFTAGQRNGAIIYNYKIQNTGEERIYDKIGDICISMKAEDYLDLPGRINNYIELKFPDALQKKYNDFEREQVLELLTTEDGAEISAVNAAALSNKLLQFANGAIYDEDKNIHEVHKLKLDATKELVEAANGKPVLIFWTYRSDMYRLKKILKEYGPRELKKDEDIDAWNKGRVPVLLMHPASGGHGLNLQKGGNTIIWFGQTWSLELYQQANARLDRQGQTGVTVIYHLVAADTMDGQVIRAQERKSSKQEGLMQAIKASAAKYLK